MYDMCFDIIFQVKLEELDEPQNDLIDMEKTSQDEDNMNEVYHVELQEKESDNVTFISPQLSKEKNKTNSIHQRLDESFEILVRPHSTTTASDEWSVFGQHVANKLRGYPKKTCFIVQHFINDILFDADMGKYDASSSQFVEPPQPFPCQSSPSTSFSSKSFASFISPRNTIVPVNSPPPQT